MTNFTFELAVHPRTNLLAESKVYNSEFDSLSEDKKFTYDYHVIYTSIVSNMLTCFLVTLNVPRIRS